MAEVKVHFCEGIETHCIKGLNCQEMRVADQNGAACLCQCGSIRLINNMMKQIKRQCAKM